MTKYHEKQAQAEAAAQELLEDPRVRAVRVAFEPYNGWVVVLVPHFMDCSDLADRAEVRDGVKRPSGKTPYPPLPRDVGPRHGGRPKGEGDGGSAPAAPSRGATARVWEIASSMPGADRKAVIAACVAQGINAATASTQYGKWRKAQ